MRSEPENARVGERRPSSYSCTNAMTQTAYLAAPGHEELLARELVDVTATYDRLLVAPGAARPVSWRPATTLRG